MYAYWITWSSLLGLFVYLFLLCVSTTPQHHDSQSPKANYLCLWALDLLLYGHPSRDPFNSLKPAAHFAPLPTELYNWYELHLRAAVGDWVGQRSVSCSASFTAASTLCASSLNAFKWPDRVVSPMISINRILNAQTIRVPGLWQQLKRTRKRNHIVHADFEIPWKLIVLMIYPKAQTIGTRKTCQFYVY